MTKLEKVFYAAKAHTLGSQRRGGATMLHKLAGALGLAVIVTLFGASSATPAEDEAAFPDGFRDWFVVNSMSATKDSPVFGHVDGVHLIHVNATGLPTLKNGGPFPYLTEPFRGRRSRILGEGWRLCRRLQEICNSDGAVVESVEQVVSSRLKLFDAQLTSEEMHLSTGR
jgi:hypothetical protein